MNIYSDYVFPDKLISPVNGYKCKKITVQNIKQFGFETKEELLITYPDFPLLCEDVANQIKDASSKGSRSVKKKAAANINVAQENYKKNPKLCLVCSNPLSFTQRNNTFCSKKCSATYNNKTRGPITYTEEGLESLRRAGKRKENLEKLKTIRKTKTWCDTQLNTCVICNDTFYVKKTSGKSRKICRNSECLAQISTNKTSKIGSTNSIYYTTKTNEIVRFDSSWEYKIACYLDEKHINWIRPKTGICWIDDLGKERFYYPDFYLPDYDLYLDPKNDQVIKKDKEKLAKVSESINLIYGSVKYIKDSLDIRF